MRHPILVGGGLAAGLALALGLMLDPDAADAAPPPSKLTSPTYGDAFWKHWGDGQAELAGYELEFPRYGATRKGTAVTIFVTETFSNSARVKADPGKHPDTDTFPVMKLNLIKDFPTGVYDYNVMMSGFAAVTAVNGRPAGSLTKVSFSSQEWCGHVYHQLLFDQGKVRQQLHSYFDGEGDDATPIPAKADGVSEDGLFLWARGFAVPALEPGGSQTVPLLRSTQDARLKHKPLAWLSATLSRGKGTQQVKVPAGTFTVETLTAAISDGRTWTFHIEQAAPRRLIAWSCSTGETGKLLAAERMKYWELNGAGKETILKKLGLTSRPARTP